MEIKENETNETNNTITFDKTTVVRNDDNIVVFEAGETWNVEPVSNKE